MAWNKFLYVYHPSEEGEKPSSYLCIKNGQGKEHLVQKFCQMMIDPDG